MQMSFTWEQDNGTPSGTQLYFSAHDREKRSTHGFAWLSKSLYLLLLGEPHSWWQHHVLQESGLRSGLLSLQQEDKVLHSHIHRSCSVFPPCGNELSASRVEPRHGADCKHLHLWSLLSPSFLLFVKVHSVWNSAFYIWIIEKLLCLNYWETDRRASHSLFVFTKISLYSHF